METTPTPKHPCGAQGRALIAKARIARAKERMDLATTIQRLSCERMGQRAFVAELERRR